MSETKNDEDLEMLARMAARLAGRDPDEHHRMELASEVVFDGPMWHYPDFIARAEAAYEVLYRGSLLSPADIRNGFSREAADSCLQPDAARHPRS